MRSPDRFVVTRRQALQGIGLATLYLSTTAFPASASASSRVAALPDVDEAPATIADSITASCFSADWATRYEVDFPVAVNLAPAPDADGVTIDVEWDDRLFDVTPIVIASQEGNYEPVDVTVFSAGRMNFVLPAGATAFYMQPRVRSIYPQENIGAPVLSAIRAESEVEVLAASQEVAAAPWGLELRTAWSEFAGYSYPAVVELLSTGPNPVPAGVAVVARTYRSVSSLTAEIDGDQASSGALVSRNRIVDRTFSLDAALAANETVLISLSPEEPAESDDKPSISQVAQMFVTMPANVASDARATGRLSLASVTPSGTELTDSSASRKA